jgi:hypothetical protein
MFLLKRCPLCKELVKKKATYCKHCHSTIGDKNEANKNDGETIRYIENGFMKIGKECELIEIKLSAKKGFIITWYAYTDDELMEMVCKIDSWCEKIRGDLEKWDEKNALSDKARMVYNENAEDAQMRLEEIAFRIQERKPTFWEKVSLFFRSIASKLLPFLTFKFISGKPQPKQISQTATA